MSRTLTLLSLFISVVISCNSKNGNDSTNQGQLSEADSLEILSSILADMKEEMYATEHLNINSDTTKLMISCCDCPSKLDIRIDSLSEISINSSPIKTQNAILDSLKEYFERSKNKNQYGYAHFERLSLMEVKENVHRYQGYLHESKKLNAIEPIIAYRQLALSEWKNRLEICAILHADSINFLNKYSGVYLKYYSQNVSFNVLEIVLHGFYEIRESATQRYFGESYLRLFSRAKTQHKKSDIDKLRAINHLIPIRVVDQPNLKRYKNLTHYDCSYPYEESLVPPILVEQ